MLRHGGIDPRQVIGSTYLPRWASHKAPRQQLLRQIEVLEGEREASDNGKNDPNLTLLVTWPDAKMRCSSA